ncbi:hypothetical protein [Streptomyces liliifuscus]|uniref:Lipoprotein n=1 Tax=Streptomyces liliifuscus TaxID=2797636 RepID=A0A7T7L2E3_9ACTN|nr:hypothetical protein [Streptomyces liliifuscus]QQM45187.1 hypothetical protein JEQ17_41150 [Streptomyces liliifuscus]
MRRHIVGIIAAGLLLAGCSEGSGDDKTEPKANPEAAAETTSTAPVKLSDKWGPKLDAAGDKGEPGVCTEVGSPGCVDHITQLTEVVYDVETAIEEAGAEALYPRSMKHIDGVEAASEAYVAAECKGSTDTTLGDSACAGYAATLLLGPATLSMTMQTDEYSS